VTIQILKIQKNLCSTKIQQQAKKTDNVNFLFSQFLFTNHVLDYRSRRTAVALVRPVRALVCPIASSAIRDTLARRVAFEFAHCTVLWTRFAHAVERSVLTRAAYDTDRINVTATQWRCIQGESDKSSPPEVFWHFP